MQPAHQTHGFYPFVHILRGIAPLLVLWSHLAMYFIYDHKITDWAPAKAWVDFFVFPLHLYLNAGHLGVVLFFFVSGFIITHASMREGYREFAIKRWLRIFPVLLLALAIQFLARYCTQRLGLGSLTGTAIDDVGSYVKAFFLLDMLQGTPQALSVTWTLVTEVSYYLLTLLLLGVTKRNPEKATYLMIALWMAIEMSLSGFTELGYLRQYTVYIGLLIAGRTLYLADTGIVGWRKSTPMLLSISVAFVLFHTHHFPGILLLPTYQPAATYAMAIVMFLAAMTYGATKVPRALAFFADISLSLYLLHIPVGMFVITYAHYGQGLTFTPSLILGTLASIGASWVAYRYVERPCQKLARRLTPRRLVPATEATVATTVPM